MQRNIEINSRRKEIGNSSWVEPSISPACLTSSLITFEFVGIQNIKTDLDFMRYIVSHSSKLEKVKIFTPSSKKRRIEKSLRKRSKKSSVLVWVRILHTFFSSIQSLYTFCFNEKGWYVNICWYDVVGW